MKIAKSEKLNLPFPFAYGIGMSSQCEGDSNLRKLDHDGELCLLNRNLYEPANSCIGRCVSFHLHASNLIDVLL